MRGGNGRHSFDFGAVKVLSAIILASTTAASAPPAPPDAEPHELKPAFLNTSPAIDGVLDEAAWQAAPLPLGSWVSYNPLFGEQVAQQTQVWVAYDNQNIYFAFRCMDPEPDKIKSSVSRRDSLWSDDWVGLSLDAIGGGQNSYDMFVNPNGIQGDIFNSATAGESSSVDWVWESAGRRTNQGYEVEIRLPLKSIRFSSGKQIRMGVLFWRHISRLGISVSWPSLPPGRSLFTRHAPLVFENLKAPLKLDLIPNLTYAWSQQKAEPGQWAHGDSRLDAGLTFKYGFGASITLDGTFRPDFSQVESDAYQIEVNQRYPVFYSEKRPFFMEGMGLFELAGSGGDANLRTAVHTRRIADPLYGAKLTGSAGKFNFATLLAADRAPGRGDVPPELAGADKLFNIARATYSLGNGSYVGGLMVDTKFGPEYNRAAAGDIFMRIGEHHRWSATLIETRTRRANDRSRQSGRGGQLNYGYDSRRYSSNLQLEHFDTGFNLDTAFYNRTGYTGANFYFGRSFYPDQKQWPWFKRFVPFVSATGGRDRPQGGNEYIALAGFRFYFTRQGYLHLDAGRAQIPWRLREFPFRFYRIMSDVQLYRWLHLVGRIFLFPRAAYFDPKNPSPGKQLTLGVNATFQTSEKLRQEFSYDRDALSPLAGGGRIYAVNIVNFRNTYQFDRSFSARAILRYDSSKNRILGDLLGAWELVPGTVAYIGYGAIFERRSWEGGAWIHNQGDYMSTRRGLFFKLSYLYSF